MSVIICNSTRWGGTGGEFAVLSNHPQAHTILFHELGHSFGKLADEYYYPTDGAFGGREAANCTKNGDANSIKWKHLIGVNNVGIYPYSTGVDRNQPGFDSNSDLWFKPHLNCKMQTASKDFCPVCSEELIRKLTEVSKFLPNAPSYRQNGMEVTIIRKIGGTWTLRLTNKTGNSKVFLYNSRMCFYNDAKNWSGLKDIAQTTTLENGKSTTLEISEYGTATSIALSYVSGNRQYIFYADNLNPSSGTMSSYSSSKAYNSYERQGMKVSIVGKNGGTWLLELTNNTGSGRYFQYNSRMCFEDDAKNWKGLAHQKEIYISNGATEQIEISEYGTATSIAISYKDGNAGKCIFYAYNLSTNGTMTSYGTYKAIHYYTYNGMIVAILEKIGSTWLIELTNNTGKPQNFEYNSRMCFEGDAQNWTGLSHVNKRFLQNGESTVEPIYISEYGTATSITISYMDGIYRKIFYANNLNATTCTMTANGNTKDTTVQDSCLAAGTLITLADGSQKAVEELTGNEMLLVWNMKTGTYDTAPIMFIDSDPIHTNDIINLHFSDETTVKVIYEHGFWDFDLNSYVYLDENAEEYVGHWFNKQTTDAAGNYTWEKVQLTEVTFTQEYTTAWSPVTYGHLCYFVNGMLSMPGGIDGLFNIFEVDSETLTYNTEAMNADIEEYGLFTYEEFYEMYPISEEVFDAFNGEYLKVAIGKGLITYERIGELIERYAEFF